MAHLMLQPRRNNSRNVHHNLFEEGRDYRSNAVEDVGREEKNGGLGPIKGICFFRSSLYSFNNESYNKTACGWKIQNMTHYLPWDKSIGDGMCIILDLHLWI